VIVDVVVTDEHGGVVPALTAEDFEVVERASRRPSGRSPKCRCPWSVR
jgi:hypothetical protein